MNFRSSVANSGKRYSAFIEYLGNLLSKEIVRFLIVGGISFLIDFGLLTLLHGYFGVELWVATPVAFLTSLFFNFLLQRTFTFKAGNNRSVSFLKYSILVVLNTFAADLIVNAADWMGAGYQIGKVISTVMATIWNYFLYKNWIFKSGSNTKSELAETPSLEIS